MTLDPNLTTQPNTFPRGASSRIDLPVEPVTADIAYQAMIRLEAKMDAIGAQLNWVTSTVQEFVTVIQKSPMAGMFAKKMEQNRG